MGRVGPASTLRSLDRMPRGFERLELRLGLGAEDAAQARHAHVMLVEILALVGVGLELLEHDAVLLQHAPVPGLKLVLVEEAPGVALPALDLAAAPVEHGSARLGDRRVDADDVEVAARPAGRWIGNLEAQPVRTGVEELRPVE